MELVALEIDFLIFFFFIIELFPLLVSCTSPASVLLLFHCSLTSRKMRVIPQEGCMVWSSKYVSYRTCQKFSFVYDFFNQTKLLSEDPNKLVKEVSVIQ